MTRSRPSKPSTSSNQSSRLATPTYHKLPKLGPNQRIQKRPLMHPPITSLNASKDTPHIIYVSAASPFIAVVKRVQKAVEKMEKRTVEVSIANGALKEEAKGKSMQKGEGGGGVLLKGTGRAIEKVLKIALWFQGQEKFDVKLRMSDVGTVDDVVARGGDGDGEVEESRVRKMSCLEIEIGLK
ncbi:hypothetical protein B7494_g327 [Chlorociboria aeruginascens]|nr:hypothetical protein B7494_g327 [Chlorociboria aeruginascens]